MQWDTQMVAESLSLKSALWRVSGRLETALKQEGRAIYMTLPSAWKVFR